MAETPQFLTLAGNRDRSEKYELAFTGLVLAVGSFGLLTLAVS